MKPRVSLVILAAGKSERFGRNKMLEPVDSKPLIQRVVENALRSKVAAVVVVTGYDAEKIEAALRSYADPRLRLVYNENYEEGQSSSVRRGVSEVVDESDAVMILPGDVAFISAGDIDALIDEYANAKAKIVVASHKGRRGHPILFSRELFDEVLAIREETRGLKEVVRKHYNEVRTVERGSQVLADVDTPEDLREYTVKFRNTDSDNC